jgi:hypothetical protein
MSILNTRLRKARDVAGRIAEALRQVSREATFILCARALDRHPETMAELADRVFCINEMHRKLGLRRRSIPEIAGQTTWEAFS